MREPDAVVGEAVLLEVVGADLLAATAPAHLGLALDRLLRRHALLLQLQQPRPQHRHGPRPVLQLAALVLHRHDHTGRPVRDAHGGVGGVHVLAAGRRRPVGVDRRGRPGRCRCRPRRPRAAPAPWPTTCARGPGSRSPARAAHGAGRPRTSGGSRRRRRGSRNVTWLNPPRSLTGRPTGSRTASRGAWRSPGTSRTGRGRTGSPPRRPRPRGSP